MGMIQNGDALPKTYIFSIGHVALAAIIGTFIPAPLNSLNQCNVCENQALVD